MIIDYSILILIAIVGGCSVTGMKWYLQYREKMEKQIIKEQNEAKKPENQIDTLIDNLPAILDDRRKLYMEACRGPEGPDGKMAKSLKQQIDLLTMAESIPAPVLGILKPIAMKALKAVSSFKL